MEIVSIKEVIVPRIAELIQSAWNNPNVFWTILPLLVTVISMQVYFGRNRTEKLGWNTAFGNSIIFTFICASLIRHMFLTYSLDDFTFPSQALDKLLIIIGFVILGIYMIWGNFMHTMPKKLAYSISSPVFTNGISVIVVILIQSRIQLDSATYAAAFLIFLILLIIEAAIKHLISPSPEALKQIELEKRNQDIERLRRKQIREQRHLQAVEMRRHRLQQLKNRLAFWR